MLTRLRSMLSRVIRNITVEPAVLVIVAAQAMDMATVDEMLLYKACTNDFGYPDDLCSSIEDEKWKLNLTTLSMVQDVQAKFTEFQVRQRWCQSVVPIFLAFYLGAWCDLFGRKPVMFIFFGGTILSQLLVVLNAFFIDWPIDLFLITTLPMALSGGLSSYMISMNAFLSDISSPESRTFRLAMLSNAFQLGAPLGILLGVIVYSRMSFLGVVSTSLVALVLGVLFLYVRLRSFHWQPEKKQVAVGSAFHPRNALEALQTPFKSRPGPNRRLLLLLTATLILNSVSFAGERVISYVYVKNRYNWSLQDFSVHKSIVMFVGLGAQMIVVPLLRLVRSNDAIVLVCLLVLRLLNDLGTVFASEGWQYYCISFLDIMGGYSLSICRSLMASCVPRSDLGKVYAFLSSMDNLIPVTFTLLYQFVFQRTQTSAPGAPFLVSTATTSLALALAVVVLVMLGGKNIADVAFDYNNKEDGSRIDYDKERPKENPMTIKDEGTKG